MHTYIALQNRGLARSLHTNTQKRVVSANAARNIQTCMRCIIIIIIIIIIGVSRIGKSGEQKIRDFGGQASSGLYYYYFLTHQHKAAGMKIKLSKNNDHDGILLGVKSA